MEHTCRNHGCVILCRGLPGSSNNGKSIRANCSSDFNRKPAPSLDNLIDENWASLKQEMGDKLYNWSKFRIHSVEQAHEDEVVIEVGLTDYKEYIGTNLGKDLDLFLKYGEKNYGNSQACLSDALGVGSMVVTADDHFLFVQRSFEVAEGRGLIDFPGGHAEPTEMLKKSGYKNFDNIDLSMVKSEDVIHEIFYSMVREVRDEINIPENSLSWPSLLGFLRNSTNGGKPHAAFIINCNLDKGKIEELFKKGGPEAYESLRILFIKKEHLLSMSLDELTEKVGEMTPCAKATLYLYFCSLKQV